MNKDCGRFQSSAGPAAGWFDFFFTPARHWEGRLWRLLAGLLALACLGVQSVGATPWRQAGAEFRLLATPQAVRAHTARLDLPLELRGNAEQAIAYDRQGQQLNVRPVTMAGETVALEIALPQAALMPATRTQRPEQARPASFYVYLPAASEADPGDAEPANNSEFQPVAVYYEPEQMIARPWRFEDAMTHAASRDPLPLFAVHHDFAPALATPRQRGRTGYRYRLSTLLKVDQAKTVRFAVNARHTGWFLFLNQRPLHSWQEAAEESEGLLISRPVNLDAGLQSIDLYVFHRPGENNPRLQWATDAQGAFTPIPRDTMVSSQAVAELVIEHRTDGRIGGYQVQSVDRLLVPGKGLEYQAWTVTDAEDEEREPEADRPAAKLFLDHRPVVPGQAMIFEQHPKELRLRPQPPQPNQANRQYTIPLLAPWSNPQLVDPDFVLTRTPVLVEAGEELRIEGRFGNLPAIVNRLGDQQLQVQWRLSDGLDRTARREIELPEQTEGDFTLRIPLVPSTARILQTSLLLDRLPLSHELETRLIPPHDIPANLMATGKQLTVDGQCAILLLPRDNDPAAGEPVARQHRIERIVIADEFWATITAPGAYLPLAPVIQNLSGKQVDHIHIGDLLTRNLARPDLLKFSLVSQVLSSPADTVVWAVGPLDLRHQQSLEQLLTRLRYLVKATLAHDKLPMLCTIPPVPGIDPPLLREAAIAIKQMGLDYGIPVIDLHSRAGLEFESGNQAIERFFRLNRHQLQLLHPNNAGRRWFSQMINENLSEPADDH